MNYYCPMLLIIGSSVRSCTWDGRKQGGGKVAKEALQHCLVVLIHLFGSNAAKVEYVRTLSTALLAWQKWMDKLPGCCFVEESCEALLSRMAARCRGNPTISSFSGVMDLYLTLPPPSRTPKHTRGTLRQGLLQTFWVRARRLIARAGASPFSQWSSKGSQFEQAMPDNFVFPRPLHSLVLEDVLPALDNSIRCVRSKARITAEVQQFLETKVPRASPTHTADDQLAVRKVRRIPPLPRANPPVAPVLK